MNDQTRETQRQAIMETYAQQVERHLCNCW